MSKGQLSAAVLVQLAAVSLVVPSCNSHLRRDDLTGRPCPCLPGWDERHDADGTCVCVVRAGSAGGSAATTGTATSSTQSGGSSSDGSSDTAWSGGTSTQVTATGGNSSDTQNGGSAALGGSSSEDTGNGGGGASSFAGAGNANNCPTVPLPSESTPCANSCNACSRGECQFYCNVSAACSGQIVNCAPGMSCHVICSGVDSCEALVVNCPAQYPCQVECTGRGACENLQLNCSTDGPCSLDCASGVCRNSSLYCGKNACRYSCNRQINAYDCAGSCIPGCGCP